MRTLIGIAALFTAAVSLGDPGYAQSSTPTYPADPGPPSDTRERLAWFTDGQMRLAARAWVGWKLIAADAGNGPTGVVGGSAVVAMMPPIPVVPHGFGHYAELRLTGSDVLLTGDRLTLRAGSDLHFFVQGAGGGDWADVAAALAGWRSRAELRWARPTTIGEFSFTCHVDRKGEAFSRGQAQARWVVRF
jgi:hypothetical protein